MEAKESQKTLQFNRQNISPQSGLEGSSVSPPKSEVAEESLIGKQVRVFADAFSPEVIGIVEVTRGYGSLRLIEVRVGIKIRVAREGEYELLEGGEA